MTRIHAVRTAVAAITLLVLGAGALRAQRSLDTTFTVRAQPRLSVTNMSGTIVIRSWSRSEIRVQADYDRARVEVYESSSRVNVRTVTRGGDSEVDYTISVPRGTGVEVSGISSDVRVGDVCGDIGVNTVSGDVTADCVEGEAHIQSVSGDIEVSNVRGQLDVGSTSGDVQVRGVRSPRGGVQAHSVSGDVSLSQIDCDDVSAETVSGDIEYGGRIADNGHYRFEAHSGDLTLRVAGPFNATVSVTTFSGDFASDFPIELVPGAHNISREWEFKQGTGSARVRLQSFSGSINLRRASGTPREE